MLESKDGRIFFRGQWAPDNVNEVLCLVGGCDGPRSAKGLCGMHYQRWRRKKASDAKAGAAPKQFEPTEAELRAFGIIPEIERRKADAALTDTQLEAREELIELRGAEYVASLKPWQYEQEAERERVVADGASGKED